MRLVQALLNHQTMPALSTEPAPNIAFILGSPSALLQPPAPHFLESSNHSDLTSLALQAHRCAFQTFSSTKSSSPWRDAAWDAASWEGQGWQNTPMLRPRHREGRFRLWTEGLQHKDSCKHHIPAGFPFLAYFKVFELRSQGEDPQGHSKICLGCIHAFSISSQGVVWHIPRTAAHCAMALSKRSNTHLRAETGSLRHKRPVLKELHPTKHPSGTISPQNIPLAVSPPASCLHRDVEGPVPAGHPQLAASPPFELVSSSPSTAVRGKFGLGCGTLLCPDRGDHRLRGPAWLPGREEGCERGGGVFHQ